MKLQTPPNVDSISCGSFVGCKELTEMMHPAPHQRRRGERIRGSEGDANGWIEWVCAWVLWCGSRTVRWCRWMRNHRQPLLHQENILLGCTHSARAGCKVNCALEAVQSFNSSAMFQQQCNVSTAVQCFNSSVGWQWMRNQAAFKANNSPVNNSSQTLFRGF